MPLLQVFTSAHPAEEHKRAQLLKSLSALVARLLNKPESYVMISLAARAEMSFAGSGVLCGMRMQFFLCNVSGSIACFPGLHPHWQPRRKSKRNIGGAVSSPSDACIK